MLTVVRDEGVAKLNRLFTVCYGRVMDALGPRVSPRYSVVPRFDQRLM